MHTHSPVTHVIPRDSHTHLTPSLRYRTSLTCPNTVLSCVCGWISVFSPAAYLIRSEEIKWARGWFVIWSALSFPILPKISSLPTKPRRNLPWSFSLRQYTFINLYIKVHDLDFVAILNWRCWLLGRILPHEYLQCHFETSTEPAKTVYVSIDVLCRQSKCKFDVYWTMHHLDNWRIKSN